MYLRKFFEEKGSEKPLPLGATATTAASGGNREELLGPRPAGCERQRSRRWEPQPGLGERSETERASPSPESRRTAISCLFGRAMLSLRLLFSVSILALSGAPRQLSQRESLGQRGQALRDAKASPLGRGGIAQAMTERASPSPESRHAAISRFFGRAKLCPNFSIHAGKRAIRAGFIDFFPADVVYSK